MSRSPLFKRLKEEEVKKALDALTCLQLLGLESIESVRVTIKDLSDMMTDVKKINTQVVVEDVESTVCSSEHKEASARLMQTVSILRESLSEKTPTEFTVEMTDSSNSRFQELVTATKQFDTENLLDSSCNVKYVDFPTTTTVDSFRGTTRTRQVCFFFFFFKYNYSFSKSINISKNRF